MRRTLVAAMVPLLSACAASHAPRAATPLAAHEVAWNAAQIPTGHAVAVAELGDTLLIAATDGATVVVSGTLSAADHTAKGFSWAGTLAAPDGSGTWLIATTAEGELRRVRSRASLEPVGDRFGLAKDHVRAACSAGPRDTAFLLESGLARSDGGHVHRVDGAFTEVACGGAVIAAASAAGVRVLGAAGGDRMLALPSPHVAVTARGRLVASSGNQLFAASPTGDLVRVHDAPAPIVALAAAGDGVWFATAGMLGWFDGQAVQETARPQLATDASLAASPSGDVWMTSGGAVTRVSRGAALAKGGEFQTTIAPIFQRTCSRCHGPGGSSGLDLSTETAWSASRAELKKRVLEKKDMPPAGVPFPSADREAVRRFLGP